MQLFCINFYKHVSPPRISNLSVGTFPIRHAHEVPNAKKKYETRRPCFCVQISFPLNLIVWVECQHNINVNIHTHTPQTVQQWLSNGVQPDKSEMPVSFCWLLSDLSVSTRGRIYVVCTSVSVVRRSGSDGAGIFEQIRRQYQDILLFEVFPRS